MARALKKDHPLQTIADEGRTQATKGESSVSMAQSVLPGLRAKGEALAELVLKEAEGHSKAWTNHYLSLCKLSAEGREAFATILRKATRREEAIMVGTDGKPVGGTKASGIESHKQMFRSARVRLSEFMRICKAMSAVGVEPFAKITSFHAAVGYSKTVTGSTGRGRKAKAADQKVADYLKAHVDDVGGWEALAKMVATLAKQAADEAKASAKAPTDMADKIKESLKAPRKASSRAKPAKTGAVVHH